MKFILQKNVQCLIHIIQKLCFYYEYNKIYTFSFKSAELFYTSVIEIENNKKFQYISLLLTPLLLKNKSIEAKNTIVYYKRNRNKNKENTEKLTENYHKIYNKFIHYVFDSSTADIGFSQELKDKIKEGEELFNHPIVKEIQDLYNDESEDLEKNNISKDSLRIRKLKKIITGCKLNEEQTLWILFHGLFITIDKVIEKYPECYKYYSFNKFTPDRLSKGTVFFNHPKNFNDPFDINCFTDADGNIDKNASERNSVRVFCSTKQNDNILMWSHYGANHTGYCIEYSTKSIISCMNAVLPNVKLITVGNVLYNDKRKIFESGKFNVNKLIRASFKKSKKWKYENEFRFVIINSNGFEDLGFSDEGIPLEHAEIKNIYLGAEIKPNDLSIVYNITQPPLIKRMTLGRNGYKVSAK